MNEESKIELSGIFENGYGIIPKKIMQDKNLTIYDKGVLAYMLSFTGGGNSCFPSYAKIQEELKISRGSVAKSIKNLSQNGYIEIQKLYPNDPLRHNNKYILCFLGELPKVHKINSHSLPDRPPQSTAKTSNNNIINNNIINNNIKVGFKKPSILEIKHYLLEKSINPKIANLYSKRIYDYYDIANWRDSKGAPVRSWKQKIIAVWLKQIEAESKKESVYADL